MAMQQTVRYMIEERVSLLTAYLCYDADYAEIVGDFQHRFSNQPVPMRQMIHRLNKKFQRMGLVSDAPKVVVLLPLSRKETCLTVRNCCIDENGFQFEHKI